MIINLGACGRRGLLAGLVVVAVAAVGCGGGSPAPGGDAARGREVAVAKGCVSCHTSDGSRSTGPSWGGIWGETVTFGDGSTGVVDEAYVVRSVQDPNAQLVDGFGPTMPKIPLTDDEVAALVAYIRSLGPPATTSE